MKPALFLYLALGYFGIYLVHSLNIVLRSYSIATMNTFHSFMPINTLHRCIVCFAYLGVFWIFWMFSSVLYVGEDFVSILL